MPKRFSTTRKGFFSVGLVDPYSDEESAVLKALAHERQVKHLQTLAHTDVLRVLKGMGYSQADETIARLRKQVADYEYCLRGYARAGRSWTNFARETLEMYGALATPEQIDPTLPPAAEPAAKQIPEPALPPRSVGSARRATSS